MGQKRPFLRSNGRFGSKADICSATRHVCFIPNSDRKSRHRLIGRMLLASVTEEYDYAEQYEPDLTCAHWSTLEQGQIDWSKTAAQTEAYLGDPRHAPK